MTTAQAIHQLTEELFATNLLLFAIAASLWASIFFKGRR